MRSCCGVPTLAWEPRPSSTGRPSGSRYSLMSRMSRLVDGARGGVGGPRLSMLSRGVEASATCPGKATAAAAPAAAARLPLRPDLPTPGWAPLPLLADLEVPPLLAAPSCACQPSRAACAAPELLPQVLDADAGSGHVNNHALHSTTEIG
jgi:hypothetical protein